MKIPLFFPLAAAVSLAAAVPGSATTFSQFFNNGPTGATPHQDKNANTYSWQAAIGTSAFIDSTLGTGGADTFQTGVSQGGAVTGLPGSTNAGFLFTLPTGSIEPGVVLLHNTNLATSDVFQNAPNQPANNTAANSIQWYRDQPQSLAGLTVGEIKTLSVYTRAENTSTVMRFALRISGIWYVSETSYQQTSSGAWEKQELDPMSVSWREDVFSTGFLDDDLSDNPLVNLSGEMVVTGYGWYADTGTLAGGSARVRIDAFQITTDPIDNYSQWAAGPFANPFTDTDPESDPDHDGLSNLMEFVLGGDPTISQPGIAPESEVAGGVWTIRFKRSEGALDDGVVVKVQFSDDLANWLPGNEVVIGPVSDPGPVGGVGASYTVVPDGVTKLDEVVVSVPATAARKFARVVAVR